jgi:hypothetical protein
MSGECQHTHQVQQWPGIILEADLLDATQVAQVAQRGLFNGHRFRIVSNYSPVASLNLTTILYSSQRQGVKNASESTAKFHARSRYGIPWV